MSTTTIGETSNLEFILSDHDWEAGLRLALAAHPDWCALQEALDHRDNILNRVCRELGYSWARAKGGEPVLWKTARYGTTPRWVRPVRLARAECVGHLPGRKDRLPASIATEVGLNDLQATHPDGGVTVVIDFHMTAEVQYGDSYRHDPAHLLRVLRHRREKRRLGRRLRMHKRRGHRAWGAGDGNFSGLEVGGFENCWTGHPGGDLGGRPVSIIFADSTPAKLWMVETPSDHKTVVATYR